MKRIEWFWNMVYYNIYRCDARLRKLFDYLNPFYLINNIPAVKKFHAKHGVNDMNKFANRMLNNPKSGLSSIWAGSFMGGLLVLIGIGLLNVCETIIGRSIIRDVTKDSLHFIIFAVVLMGPTILINNFLLFRKDKYLNYFKEFEAMPNKKKSVYGWLTLLVVVLIFSFLIGSFLVL
jgi:hypothetical protein